MLNKLKVYWMEMTATFNFVTKITLKLISTPVMKETASSDSNPQDLSLLYFLDVCEKVYFSAGVGEVACT